MKSLSPANLASEMIELQELLRDSPRRVSQLLNTLAENKFRVHVTGLEESRLIESMQKIANRISAGVITAAMILGATLMMRVPTATTIFGYQFMREVRKLPGSSGGRTPAVALTAFARPEDRTRALMAGYQVHLSKPIEPHELAATVASLAGRMDPHSD